MTRCCVRATAQTEQWQRFPAMRVQMALDRVELLRQAPEFLGMVDAGRPPTRAVFAGPQSSSGRVFVAVDEAGGLTLVGCPDQEAEGGLAAMVGDLLAVSGRLWNQQVSTIAGLFEKQTGQPLVEAVRARTGAEFRPDRFMLDLARALHEGKFPVVILVDRRDAAVDETMKYLGGMNLDVQLVGYECFRKGGIEVVRPVRLSADAPARPAEAAPARPVERPEPPKPRPPVAPPRPADEPGRTYEPLPTQGTSPKQQEILKRLVYIEDLGLMRHGLEFFAPGVERRPEAEGTIVIAVEKTRWPFVSEEEVIVVVRTAREHFAGFLGMKQQEVEDFLNSLPREQRKERKGALLLRASNVYEANQLLNELKALKEIAQTTRAG